MFEWRWRIPVTSRAPAQRHQCLQRSPRCAGQNHERRPEQLMLIAESNDDSLLLSQHISVSKKWGVSLNPNTFVRPIDTKKRVRPCHTGVAVKEGLGMQL